MVVAILADAPTLTTGFGRTTSRIAGALARGGHRVTCFGLKATPDDASASAEDYAIWPAEQGGRWTGTLPDFFRAIRPDVLLLNMDSYNAVECLDECRSAGWRGPVVSYVCFDGLPVAPSYLEAQRSCDSVWTTSQVGAGYLRRNGVPVSGVAPPGMDRSVFRPHPDPDALRERAGLAATAVVGVFATNTERKQIIRVLEALPRVLGRLSRPDIRLYLHCRRDGYWNLDKIAADLGLDEQVLFPDTNGFDEHRGVPTTSPDGPKPRPTGFGQTMPGDLSYVERLNCCDVIVNIPHSGDVEQVILEAQACGIPLVHTDDNGIMGAALGPGSIKLPARETGVGRQGQSLHYVTAEDIADELVSLLRAPSRRAELREAGLLNGARYPWDLLEQAACAMVAPFDKPVRSSG